MKNILTTLACVTMLSSVASADAMKIEAGAGVWQQTSEGDASYTNLLAGMYGYNKVSEKENNKGYMWMLIKHPIPIVPNLRVEYTSLESAGVATGEFKKYGITAGTQASTLLKMEQYDIIPYYNIIDNLGWTTVDVGLDLKVVDVCYKADNVYLTGIPGVTTTYKDSDTAVIPLLYVRARVEFPSTGLAIEGDTKYIGYDKTHVVDTRAKIDYTFDIGLPVKPAIEVGYRIQSYKLDEDDEEAKLDLTFSGFYAGIMIRY